MSQLRYNAMLSFIRPGDLVEVQNLQGSPVDSWVQSRVQKTEFGVSSDNNSPDLIYNVSVVPLNQSVNWNLVTETVVLSDCRPLQPQEKIHPVVGKTVEFLGNHMWSKGTIVRIDIPGSCVLIRPFDGKELLAVQISDLRQTRHWQERTGEWICAEDLQEEVAEVAEVVQVAEVAVAHQVAIAHTLRRRQRRQRSTPKRRLAL